MRILNLDPPIVRNDMIPGAKPEVKIFQVNGRSILFDCNSLAAALFEQPLPDFPQGIVPGSKFKPNFKRAEPNPSGKVRAIVLEATHACPLACSYCFARKYDDLSSNMPFETAKKAIETYFEPPEGEGKGTISFFGGEPLLNWKLIESVTPFVRSQWPKEKVTLHVTTNGVLLDAPKVKFLDDNGFTLIVSLDGPPEIHNKSRPMKSGADSFLATDFALERLAGKGIAKRTTLRGTFHPSCIKLAERLACLNAYIADGQAGSVSVEPACISESCASKEGKWDFDALAREYRSAAMWFMSEVKTKRRPKFMHYEKTLERILLYQHSGTECGAGCGYLSFGPTGEIFACHRESGSRIGYLDYGIDEELRVKWMENRIYARRGCMDCWIRYVCGGGCRQDSLETGREIFEPNPDACRIKRLWVENALFMASELTKEELEWLYPKAR